MGSNLMRTVTFADLELVDYIKQNFVTVWHNQAPEIFSEEGQQAKCTPEQAKAYPQGGGGGNVRSYFCLPDGQVVYYLEGFWSRERFMAEAKFARELADKVGQANDRQSVIRQALAERRNQVNQEREELVKQHPEEFQKKVFESEIRKREAALGLLAKTLEVSEAVIKSPMAQIMVSLQNRRKAIV